VRNCYAMSTFYKLLHSEFLMKAKEKFKKKWQSYSYILYVLGYSG
jgi:hypothetical protein